MRLRRLLPRVCCVALAALCCAPAGADRAYRWVDEDGVVHYGDRVPPEHSAQDSDVLNRHGVTIGRREGARSEAEREAEAARAEAARQRLARQRRDRVLLDTYLSVDEIERLRDRRLELLEAQMTVTRQNLERLHEAMAALEREAAEFRPRSGDPDAPPLPEDLEQDLARTSRSIEIYERTLEDSEAQKARMQAQFERDIARFRELRGERRGP